jgi:hypothetical protein
MKPPCSPALGEGLGDVARFPQGGLALVAHQVFFSFWHRARKRYPETNKSKFLMSICHAHHYPHYF